MYTVLYSDDLWWTASFKLVQNGFSELFYFGFFSHPPYFYSKNTDMGPSSDSFWTKFPLKCIYGECEFSTCSMFHCRDHESMHNVCK